MRKPWVAIGLACGLLPGAPAGAQAVTSSIGVYFSADGSICDLTLAPLTQFTAYIIAHLGDDGLANGMTGAEFRVDGWDPTWLANLTPNPQANVTLGNPLQGGCQIGFPSCQTGGMTRSVLLYTIGALSGMSAPPTRLEVRPHTLPADPMFACPNLVNCAAPAFPRFCVQVNAACINQPQTCCILPVSQGTWTQVRALYRGAP